MCHLIKMVISPCTLSASLQRCIDRMKRNRAELVDKVRGIDSRSLTDFMHEEWTSSNQAIGVGGALVSYSLTICVVGAYVSYSLTIGLIHPLTIVCNVYVNIRYKIYSYTIYCSMVSQTI